MINPPILLEPHQIGHEGPFWVDCTQIQYDGTRGQIIHSTGFYATRGLALAAARRWLDWRRRTTVVLPA